MFSRLIFKRFFQNNFKRQIEFRRETPNDVIEKILTSSSAKNGDDWKTVRENILEASPSINRNNVDSLTIQYFISRKDIEQGRSYLNFLMENGSINLSSIGKYFKLFYLTNSNKLINKEDEATVLSLYNDVRKKYGTLDSISCENIIPTLSLTKNWEDCLNLLNEIKITATPSDNCYGAIVAACFNNNNMEKGWALLDVLFEQGGAPTEQVYFALIKRCLQCTTWSEDLTKFYNLLGMSNIQIPGSVSTTLIEMYHQLGGRAKMAKITVNGLCVNCKSPLDPLHVSQEDFENLKAEFLQNVIIGKNVFNKTTPGELKRFQDFVDSMGSFDVIIDGLNVAYCVGTKQSPMVTSRFVVATVKHFVEQHKKVLVFGRKHMLKWPKANMSYVATNAELFLTDNLSQDDPYLLYCALCSGSNTSIVSRDLMRSHMYLIKTQRNKVLFKKWFAQNQYILRYVDKNMKVYFKVPLPYIRMPQYNNGHWHLPVEKKDNDGNDLNCWICAKR